MSHDPSYDLIFAVRQNNIDRVKTLINTFGQSYSKEWLEGYVLLREAIQRSHSEIAKFLLTSGSRVNSKNGRSVDTPLHFAVENNDDEMVDMLLDRNANVNAKDHRDEIPLIRAVNNGNEKIVESLLKRMTHVEDKSHMGQTSLHIAASTGNLKIVECLVKHGAFVNSLCSLNYHEGYRPLHFACEHGYDKIVELLLYEGANVNVITTRRKSTPLHCAARFNHDKIVKKLLEHGGIDVNARDSNDKTVLQVAIENGNLSTVTHIIELCPEINNEKNKSCINAALYGRNIEICEKIIETFLGYGITVNSTDAKDEKLLDAAIVKGQVKIVKQLIDYGADVNSSKPGKKGFTLLHNAVCNKQFETAEILIKHGAYVNATDEYGKFPICWAVENNDVRTMQLLLSSGAKINNCRDLLHTAVKVSSKEIVEIILRQSDFDVNTSDRFGQIALHYTVRDEYDKSTLDKSELDIAEAILRRGANVNARNLSGWTTLHIAIIHENTELVEILLKYNADVNIVDECDETPLHISARKSNEAISVMLLKNGARVNVKDNISNTPLHVACQTSNGKIVTMLLEHGNEIDCRNNQYSSPLQIAVEEGSLEIVKILLNNFAEYELRGKHNRTALHNATIYERPEIINELLEHGCDINVTCNEGLSPLYYTSVRKHIFPDNEYEDYYDDYRLHYDEQDDFINDDYRINDNYPTDGESIDYLVMHIVKIKALNMPVNRQNLDSIDINGKDKLFYDNCTFEIERMKNEYIVDTNVTFHDILTKDTRQLALYARNESVTKVFESDSYKNDFPIYGNMIYNNFKKGVHRRNLLNSSQKSLNLLSRFVLPELYTAELFSYLRNKDLKRLIKAGE